MSARDPWLVLGVDRSADDAQIKKAYRRLARAHHPDHNRDDPSAEARFREVAAAYEQIKNAEARATFGPAQTTHRRGAAPADEGTDWGSLFNDAAADVTRGKDVALEVSVTFTQAFTGATIDANTRVEEPCAQCGGSGATPGTNVHQCHVCRGAGFHQVGRITTECASCDGRGSLFDARCGACTDGRVLRTRTQRIAIPAGVSDGQQLIVDGAGEVGAGGAGNLLVTVRVGESEVFERIEGADLLVDVPVSYAEACLGSEVRIPTPERPILLHLPPGTTSGTLLRVRGRGMPTLGAEDGGRGDLYARVAVDVPSKLTTAQRRLVTQLGSHDTRDLRAHLFADTD